MERVDSAYFKDIPKVQEQAANERKSWLSSQLAKNMVSVSVALAAMSLYGITALGKLYAMRQAQMQ